MGVNGLAAYVITLHQPALLTSVGIGALLALATAALAWRFGGWRRWAMPVLMFCGSTLTCHVVISHRLGVAAMSVEVIRLAPGADDVPRAPISPG